MKQKMYRLFLFVFVLLTIFSIFILHHSHNGARTTKNKIISSFADHATYEVFNREGSMKSTTTASQITHFKNSEDTFFTKPQMTTFTINRTPWHISAYHAKSNESNERIFLWGHVNIQQLSQQNHTKTTIETSELTIFPKQSRATTSKPITIYRHDSIVQGKGFTANLQSGEYELLSQSKGIYNP